MKMKLKSILAVALCAVGFAAFAEPVKYLDWDDVEKKMTNAVCDVFEVVTADTATFEAGKTYVVLGNVTNTTGITVKGTPSNPSRLILCDGAELVAKGKNVDKEEKRSGLSVTNDCVLVICGQTAGTGKLEATGADYCSGIGGGNEGSCGTVTINGGVVTAMGGDNGGAGIGGGFQGNGGTVTVNGGVVTATGDGGAGIGVGMSGTDAGTVKFGAGAWIVMAGSAAPGTSVTPEAYTNDHSAAYAHIEPLVGTQDNPWKIGATDADTVAAWTNGTDKLVVEGAGNMKDFAEGNPAPWGAGLAEVEIGEDVTYLGANAFSGSALTSVTMVATRPPALGLNVFVGCNPALQISVPMWSKGAYLHADGWKDYMDKIVERIEGHPRWVPGHTVDSNQVGVCSWTWHGDMETVLKEMKQDGRYNGMQLALAPWLGIDNTGTYFGGKESSEMWGFIKDKIASGELNVMATMINFPKEDYTTLVSITNTQGYMYGVAEKKVEEAAKQWASNLYFTAEAARLSKELGVDTLTTEAGFICIDEPLMFDRMSNICDVCSSYGVQILIESGPQNSLYLTNLLVNLEKEGYTNVGINFDPGDTELFGSENPVDSYKIVRPWIRMVHVKDCHENDRTKEGWNEDCVWGDGIVSMMDFHDNKADPRRFIPQLRAEGYAGDILYERLSGDATLTEKRKAEITKAMDRILLDIAGKVLGSEETPWTLGEGVTAWTNGTEFVISGEGEIADLSDVSRYIKGGITAITVKDATVTGAESEAFKGFSNVSLSLPDGWQGELPEKGVWYGATGVTLTGGIPLAVKNVTSQQRYPWNGLVDVACDLTGSGEVTLSATVLTNGVTSIANPTLEGVPTIDLDAAGGVTNGVKFIWNAAADLPAGFKANGVQLKVTVEQ